jgi:hypothetical protein
MLSVVDTSENLLPEVTLTLTGPERRNATSDDNGKFTPPASGARRYLIGVE